MRILAVDYGEARTGLAISDFTGTISSPLTVIHEKKFESLIEKIAVAVSDNEACRIVVGNPINMNGTNGKKSVKCKLLAKRLNERLGLPVEMWDERLTTVAAHGIMNENNRRGKQRSERIDAVAAALILEGYLGYLKNQKGVE